MKYNYESLPKKWRDENPNKFEGTVFAFLGNIDKMDNHGFYQDLTHGKPHVFDNDMMIELAEDEL